MDFPESRETRVFTCPRAPARGQVESRVDRDSGKSFSPMKDIVLFLFFGKFSCQILVIQLKGYFCPHTVAVRHTETSQIRTTVVIYYHEIPVE